MSILPPFIKTIQWTEQRTIDSQLLPSWIRIWGTTRSHPYSQTSWLLPFCSWQNRKTRQKDRKKKEKTEAENGWWMDGVVLWHRGSQHIDRFTIHPSIHQKSNADMILCSNVVFCVLGLRTSSGVGWPMFLFPNVHFGSTRAGKSGAISMYSFGYFHWIQRKKREKRYSWNTQRRKKAHTEAVNKNIYHL